MNIEIATNMNAIWGVVKADIKSSELFCWTLQSHHPVDDSENERQMRATQEIRVLIFGVSATWEPVINIGTKFMGVLFLVSDFDNIVIMS